MRLGRVKCDRYREGGGGGQVNVSGSGMGKKVRGEEGEICIYTTQLV